MWSGASRRRESSEIGSLSQRLKALEDTIDFSKSNPTVRLAPIARVARRSLGLTRWFTFGFACSFLAGGGLALLGSLIIHPAEAKPSFGTCTKVEAGLIGSSLAGVDE